MNRIIPDYLYGQGSPSRTSLAVNKPLTPLEEERLARQVQALCGRRASDCLGHAPRSEETSLDPNWKYPRWLERMFSVN